MENELWRVEKVLLGFGVEEGVFAKQDLLEQTSLVDCTGQVYQTAKIYENQVLQWLTWGQAQKALRYIITTPRGQVIDPLDWTHGQGSFRSGSLLARINEPTHEDEVNVEIYANKQGEISCQVTVFIPANTQLFLDYGASYGYRLYPSPLYQDNGLAVYTVRAQQRAQQRSMVLGQRVDVACALYTERRHIKARHCLLQGSILITLQSQQWYQHRQAYDQFWDQTPFIHLLNSTLRYLPDGRVTPLEKHEWLSSIREPTDEKKPENVAWIEEKNQVHLVVVDGDIRPHQELLLDYGRWYCERSVRRPCVLYQNAGLSVCKDRR